MALDFPASPSVDDLYTDSGRTWRWNGTGWAMPPGPPPDINDWFVIAASDEINDLSTGTNKVYFRMPFAGTLLAVKATVNTAPTDANIEVDINEDTGSGPVTLLSTKLSIDASETTSTTAAVPAVISDSVLVDDAEMTIDIDQVGSTIKGKGLKVYLKTRRSA
jgi:3D (Asp-Asp-Asp) domain-containing protein